MHKRNRNNKKMSTSHVKRTLGHQKIPLILLIGAVGQLRDRRFSQVPLTAGKVFHCHAEATVRATLYNVSEFFLVANSFASQLSGAWIQWTGMSDQQDVATYTNETDNVFIQPMASSLTQGLKWEKTWPPYPSYHAPTESAWTLLLKAHQLKFV